WSMEEEDLKIQLFRFIDVLPILQTPAQITRHLREYLGHSSCPLPPPAKWGLKLLPEDGVLGRLVAETARTNARRMARRFIAGTTVAETLVAIAALRRQQMAFTVDLLGEAVLTEPEARHYQRAYLELVDGLTRQVNQWPVVEQIDRDHSGPMPRVNISIKLSALYSQFDPIDPRGTAAAVRERLEPILHLARSRGAFINIDMEQHAYKDLTLRIFEEVFASAPFRDWPDVGIAIQAYLRS